MEIRPALEKDLPRILELIAAARTIMRANGNPTQWPEGTPSPEKVLNDIRLGNGYMLEKEGQSVAYFALIIGPDPTYSVIYDGAWLENRNLYGTLHRIASLPEAHGVFDAVMDYALSRIGNLRIDTHRDNTIMQHLILKHGFRYCGVIIVADGTERLAYQLCKNF